MEHRCTEVMLVSLARLQPDHSVSKLTPSLGLPQRCTRNGAHGEAILQNQLQVVFPFLVLTNNYKYKPRPIRSAEKCWTIVSAVCIWMLWCTDSSQKCTSKGISRQGIVLKHRDSLQKSLCPVVICPYLCSSEVGTTSSPRFLPTSRVRGARRRAESLDTRFSGRPSCRVWKNGNI